MTDNLFIPADVMVLVPADGRNRGRLVPVERRLGQPVAGLWRDRDRKAARARRSSCTHDLRGEPLHGSRHESVLARRRRARVAADRPGGAVVEPDRRVAQSTASEERLPAPHPRTTVVPSRFGPPRGPTAGVIAAATWRQPSRHWAGCWERRSRTCDCWAGSQRAVPPAGYRRGAAPGERRRLRLGVRAPRPARNEAGIKLAAEVENLILWPGMLVLDRIHPDRREGTWPRPATNRRVVAYELATHALFGVVLGAHRR